MIAKAVPGMSVEPFEYLPGAAPVLLELPHGGHLTPPEVRPYLHPKFTPGDRREDSDEFSDRLFQGLPSNPHVLRFNVWRAHADPNRNCDDYEADGAVKTHTSQGVKIYQSDRGLPEPIRRMVIERYIRPHRVRLLELVLSPGIEKVIFCHTMPGIGTGTSGDKGHLRPLVMFGNGGDRDGNPGHPHYASRDLLLALSDVVERSIAELDVDFNFCDVVRFNDPYSGINSLGRFKPEELANKQAFTLEINRDLVLHNPDNTEPTRSLIDRIVSRVREWGSHWPSAG